GGGTISTAGLFTAGTTAGGPFTVTAASGGKTGTASLTVTAPSGNLVANWPFNEGTGITAADATGKGHTATLNGATWTPGMIGNAVSFNGAATATAANAADLQFT